MRSIVILFILGLPACGVHNFESQTASDAHKTDVEADVGPYHSRANSTTAHPSSYERCLKRYEKYYDAENICDQRMKATRPPDYRQMPYQYPYGNYPPTYQSPYGNSPYGGYNMWPSGPGYYAQPRY